MATQAMKPRLMFLAPEDCPVPGNHRETDEKWQEQQQFRARVSGDRVRASFRTPDELAGLVTEALYNWRQNKSVDQTRSVISGQVSSALGKVVTRSATLSECLVAARALARELGDSDLEQFATKELAGWGDGEWTIPDPKSPELFPEYRQISAYATQDSQLNPMFAGGWGGNLNNALEFTRQDPEHFRAVRLFINLSVLGLEQTIQRCDETTLRVYQAEMEGDVHLTIYISGLSLQRVLDGIRQQLLSRMLRHG
jgi:hypothetical protein